MPDEELLVAGERTPAEQRARLLEALNRTTRILHTPKVPAATWRAWREFERKVNERLRTDPGLA
jgi:hypothetical protein